VTCYEIHGVGNVGGWVGAGVLGVCVASMIGVESYPVDGRHAYIRAWGSVCLACTLFCPGYPLC
jgi:hypothetical protein